MRRLLKSLVVLGVIAVVVIVVKSLLEERSGSGAAPTPTAPPPTPSPASAPPKAEAAGGDRAPAWVEPDADGGCPEGYPVKAKKSSDIFHVPGGASYDRTVPDRCYASGAAAEADGLRQAKR